MESSRGEAVHHAKLSREILSVLLFKALALFLIWVLFFRAPPVPHPGPQATAAHLFGSTIPSIQVLRGVSHD